MISESSYENMSEHKKFQLKAQNLELAVDRYMPPLMTGMHNCRWNCLGEVWESSDMEKFRDTLKIRTTDYNESI